MPEPIRMENLVPGRVAKSRTATLVLACATDVGATAPAALAAPNPSGTGQPNQECEDVQLPGFGSGGFENAEAHYAGSPGTPSAANASSSYAVWQYDVACFQQESNRH
jgi:hypothetical protein